MSGYPFLVIGHIFIYIQVVPDLIVTLSNIHMELFGVGTLFAFLVAGACALMGEGTILNWGLILLMGILTDIIRCAIGNTKIAGVRISYLLLALSPFGRIIVIWTNCAEEIADQAAEMGKA